MNWKSTFQKLQNESGAGLILATLVIVTIGLTGLKIVDLSAKESSNSSSDMLGRVAEAGAQSGIETALFDLEKGLDPSKAFALAEANISVTTDPQNGLVNVQGLVPNGFIGNVKRTYKLNADFAKSQVKLKVSGASISENQLLGLVLEKKGTAKVIVDTITVSRNQSSCVRNLTCSTASSDDDDHGDDDDDDHGDDDDDDDHGDDDDDDDDDDDCNEQDDNNGHGNDCDHDDDDNPGQGGGGDDQGDDDDHGDDDDDDDHGDDDDDDDDHGDDDDDDDHGDDDDDDDHGDDDIEADEGPQVCDIDDLTDTEMADYEDCAQITGDAELQKISFSSAGVIFQDGSIPSVSTRSVGSGEIADVQDVEFSTAGNYNLTYFEFNEDIQDGTWFTVRVSFKDKSYIEETFQVHTDTSEDEVVDPANDVHEGVDYTEQSGEVTVLAADDYVLELKVVNTQITCGTNGVAIPVTVKLAKNGVYSNLFGGNSVVAGQINTVSNLHSENDYIVKATAASRSCGNFSATYASTNTTQVKTLLNGDAVPTTWSGFGGQASVQQILSGYVSSQGKIVLAQNQVIMLFELGSNGSGTGSSVDFQDLVLLITITKS